MKMKKIASLALAGALTLGLLPALSPPARADVVTTTDYTLTIPSSLSVANVGWNAASGISATGTLASGKKLTVTASSANSWALKQQDGSETVSYTMKETSDGEAKTAWEFTALPGNATLGIDVADYTDKPAGTYQDTVTFTASVEDAAIVYPFGFNKVVWYSANSAPSNFKSVSQADAKAAADAEKTSANAPGYVCIYALEGSQYKWIDSHGRGGQGSIEEIVNGYAYEEVTECGQAGDDNSIWFTVNK